MKVGIVFYDHDEPIGGPDYCIRCFGELDEDGVLTPDDKRLPFYKLDDDDQADLSSGQVVDWVSPDIWIAPAS